MPQTIPPNTTVFIHWLDADLTIAGSIFDVSGCSLFQFNGQTINTFKNGRNVSLNSLTTLVQGKGIQVSTGSSAVILPDTTLGLGAIPQGSTVFNDMNARQIFDAISALPFGTIATSKTLSATDLDFQRIAVNAPSEITISIPNDAQANIPIGNTIVLQQFNDNRFTVKGSSGVTPIFPVAGTAFKSNAKLGTVELVKYAANTWIVSGNGDAFTPTVLTPVDYFGANLILKAEPEDISASSGAIAVWGTMSQSVVANQPDVVVNGLPNGKKVVRFTAANSDFMRFPDGLALGGNAGLTMIVVAKTAAINGTIIGTSGKAPGSDNLLASIASNASGFLQSAARRTPTDASVAATQGGTAMSLTGFGVYSTIINYTTGSINTYNGLNNVATNTIASTGTSQSAQAYTGGIGASIKELSAGTYLQGDIAYVYVINKVVTNLSAFLSEYLSPASGVSV